MEVLSSKQNKEEILWENNLVMIRPTNRARYSKNMPILKILLTDNIEEN